MGETTLLPDFATKIIIPLFDVVGIVFTIALFQWLLVSKVKLSDDKSSSTDSKNGFNEALIEEEEGANEHSVVRKCIEIQAAISEGHKNWVLCIAWAPNGKHLVSGSKVGEILCWNPQTREPSGNPLIGHKKWITGILWEPLHLNAPCRRFGQLFIAGFGSSMLFGTIVGSLADKQGHKRACMTYCITYTLSCMTKHSPQYKVLMIGCVLGGMATSLLFSAFESWLVAEHFKRGFDQQWLSLNSPRRYFSAMVLLPFYLGCLKSAN